MRNALAGIERTLFWTLVFAAFAAVCAGLAARGVDRVADAFEAERGAYAIVRVVAPEGPAGLSAAETALNSSPYVAHAAPMTPERAAALLGAWSDEAGGGEEAEPLRLIEIFLEPVPGGVDVTGEISAVLAQGGVTAEVIGAPDDSGGGGMSGRISAAAGWGAAAFAGVMALIVALAARTLAARRREEIVAMADLGATRGKAAGQIGDEGAIVGLYAGALGAVMALAVAVALLFILIPGISLGVMPELILPIDLAPLAAAPLGAALAASIGARTAASLFYDRAARIA